MTDIRNLLKKSRNIKLLNILRLSSSNSERQWRKNRIKKLQQIVIKINMELAFIRQAKNITSVSIEQVEGLLLREKILLEKLKEAKEKLRIAERKLV